MKETRMNPEYRSNDKSTRNHRTAASVRQSSNRRPSNTSASGRSTSGRTSSSARRSSARKSGKNRKVSGLVRRSLILLTCLVLFGGIFHMVGSKFSAPSTVYAEEHLSELQYKLVKIQYGDSLWSIAKDHMTPGFHDINEYIDEIKECNQLSSDEIRSGCYLMVPYYEYLVSDTVIASKN